MERGAASRAERFEAQRLIAVTAAIIGLIYGYDLGSPATFTLLGILLFTVGFNFGYGSLVWVYASESFPVRLRTQGGSAMLTADLLANFIVGVVFLGALGALGGSVTFGIFLPWPWSRSPSSTYWHRRRRDARWRLSVPTGTTAAAGPRRPRREPPNQTLTALPTHP